MKTTRQKNISGASPFFFGQEREILKEIEAVLASGHLTQGPHLEKFESGFAQYVGTKYAAGVSSGGVGLELLLNAIDVSGREVIVPTDTFVATASAVFRAGGRAVFVDIKRDSLSIDPDKLERLISKDTAAVILVHMFGVMDSDIRKIQDICAKRGVILVEDAAHAHGAAYRGVRAGKLGEIACFSFYGTKVITTGEGGIITTDNKSWHDRIKQLRNHGKSLSDSRYEHISNNFRLAEIPAVIGRHQLDFLDQNIAHRNRISSIYHQKFLGHPDIELLSSDKNSTHSFWRYPVYIHPRISRNELQKVLNREHRIRITWMYEPLCHLQPLFAKTNNHHEGDFPVAEKCIKELVCLPTHLLVTEEDARLIAKLVLDEVERLG